MDSSDSKVRGVVSEVGLERDGERFRSFNLKIGVVVKAGKDLSYEDGERLMRQFRKDLLGKDVEITSITFRCSRCGRGFNNEQGLKRHIKMSHDSKLPEKTGKKAQKAVKASKSSKRTSGKSPSK